MVLLSSWTSVFEEADETCCELVGYNGDQH